MAGSATIGSLKVVLGLDTAQFESGLAKAKGSIAGFNPAAGLKTALKEVGGALDEVAGHAGLVGKALTDMGTVGLAAGVALGGISIAAGIAFGALNQVREAINDGEEFAKLAKTVGVSTDFIQEFSFAAKQSGIDSQASSAALKDLAASVGQVQSGLARAQTTKAFSAIGFTPDQLRQFQNVGDFFPVLVERISAIGNAAEQAAIAKRLGISELLPLLQSGATNFNTLARAAQDLGIVIDSSLIQQSEEAKTKLNEIDAVMKAQKDTTFAEYAKTLIAIQEAFAGAEKAGLSFLARITGTTDPTVRLKEIAQAQAAILSDNRERNSDGTLTGTARSHLARLAGEAIDQQQKVDSQPKAETGPPAKPPTALVPPTPGHSNVTASDEAIAAAAKAELQARIALTGDIAKLTALRLQEVDQETAAANRKLQDEANSKKISQAAADTAIASNNQAAIEKRALIVRQATFDAQNAELAQREAINGFAQQAAQIEASLAKTVAARNSIETKALADQQKIDRDKLVAQTDQAVIAGKLTVLAGLEELDAQKRVQTDQTLQQAQQQRAALVQEEAQRELAALDLQVQLLTAQADLQKSTYARSVIEEKILDLTQQQERIKLQAVVDSTTASDADRQEAKDKLAVLPQIQAAQRASLASQTRLIDAIGEASSSATDLASAFKAHNWARVFNDFEQTIQTVEAAFASQGKFGGIATAGSAIGSAIGGNTGGAIADGFGIAALGDAAGSALFSATTGAAFSGAIGGGLANLGLGLSAILGPIGIIAGIGVALSGLIGSKPSNDAAISTIAGTSFSISGDKKNADTTNLATSASNAILQGEALLTAAGIQLGTTVKSIDIGVRDSTHVLLSTGQTLQTAVGDAGAAAEAGLKAVLQGATFTSDAEKQLVDTMLAAGKGFDDIATALQGFDAAQLLTGSITDAINKLLDPQAYDLSQLKAAQDARAAQVQAAADAGYLTAQQLTDINTQLAKLDGVELDQVLQKYADAASQAADQLLSTAKSTTDAATQALNAARDAAIAPLQGTIAQYQQLSDTLTTFGGTIGNANDQVAISLQQARRNEAATASRAILGDASALAALPDTETQLLTASKASAHTLQEYLADEARAKNNVAAAAATATRQVSIAQQQLDAIDAQVAAAEGTTVAVEDVGTAIANLEAAQSAQAVALAASLAAAVTAASPPPPPAPEPTPAPVIPAPVTPLSSTSSPADIAAYIQAQISGGVFQGIGGQIQQFATGGSFTVGGAGGPDSQGFNLALTPGEAVDVSRPGDLAELASTMKTVVDRLESIQTDQRIAASMLVKATGSIDKRFRRVVPDGDSIKTSAA